MFGAGEPDVMTKPAAAVADALVAVVAMQRSLHWSAVLAPAVAAAVVMSPTADFSIPFARP